MEVVTIRGLRRRAVPYATWRAPLDPSLRQVALWSGPAMVLGTLLAVAWPLLLAWSQTRFFLFLGPLAGRLAWILRAMGPWVLTLNLLGLLAYGLLLAVTHGLRSGKLWCHWAALGVAAHGAANAAVISLWAGLVALNGTAWLIILVLGAIAMVLALPILLLMALVALR
ncbi:MAG: hypothetical protein GX657_00095 [Chloroflexi bacterium]|nr:hypothetical protein [Chloroflexota bacterium]